MCNYELSYSEQSGYEGVTQPTPAVCLYSPLCIRLSSLKHRSVLLFTVAVVVAFFICWAPFHAQRLYAIYGMQQQAPVVMLQIYEIMTYISGILYYVSTTINPILYHTMSLKFRDAFKVSRHLQNLVSCPNI